MMLFVGLAFFLGCLFATTTAFILRSNFSDKQLPAHAPALESNLVAETIALMEVDISGWKYQYNSGSNEWDYFKHKGAGISIAKLGDRLWMTSPVSIEFEGQPREQLKGAMYNWSANIICAQSTKLLTE